MLTKEQIFAEIAKDNVTPASDTNLTLENVVNKLDETTQKFNEFQESVTKAFEKQVVDISSKLATIGEHETEVYDNEEDHADDSAE